MNPIYNNICYENIKSFFKRDSEFSLLLIPLLKALNWNGNFRHLVENLPHFTETINITELRNTMLRLGYTSELISIPLALVPDTLLPLLYIPDNNLALIVLNKKNNNLNVISSDNSISFIDLAEEKNNFKGTAYLFSKKKERSESKKTKSSWFYNNLLQFKWPIFQALFISFILNVFMLTAPLYIINVYNRVIPTGSLTMLLSFSTAALLILISANCLHILRVRILAHIGTRIDKAVSGALIKTILHLPTSYTENHPIGKQIARIKEFNSIGNFFASPLVVTLFEVPFIGLFLVVIWFLGGNLVLIPLAITLIFALLYLISTLYVEKHTKKFQQLYATKQTFQLETLTYIHDIKSMGHEELWSTRYKDHSSDSMHAAYKSSTLTATMGIIADTVMMAAGLLVIAFGTLAAIENNLSLGGLMAIMMLTWKTLTPLKTFFASLPKINQLSTSIKQINALVNLKTEQKQSKKTTEISWSSSKIEFNRVSFRYQPNLTPALLGVNFIIHPGELVSLVGSSGSGKSTVMKLLLGLYKLQSGSILLHGINIDQLNVFELRHYLTYLPQNMRMFFGTIYQNILFANPTASYFDIEAAARLAGVYNDIMSLPKGFDTQVGDQSSVSFSASFQQRICLARGYVKHSPVLLLDEPENSLDGESDHDLLDILSYYKGKKTIIMITHRPAHMRISDRVLYFKNGQLLLNDSPEAVFKKISVTKL